MFTKSPPPLVLLLVACLAGCDAGATTGPTRDGGGGGAALDILVPVSDVVMDQPVQLEARILGMSGGASIEWTTSDTVRAVISEDGELTGRYYGSVTVRAEAGELSAEAPLEIVAGNHYSRADLLYFQEVALGAEYGSSSRVVRKWAGDVLIKVHGTPGEKDLAALSGVVDDLRRLMVGRRVELVTEGPNLDLHFAPEAEFHTIDPHYQPTNYGFFWVWWGSDNQLVRSRVLISTTDITQDARSHLIREEITQSLGLMNDSWRYPESIYYQGWTRTTGYAPIDQALIEMLYRDEIRPGMTEAEAMAVLQALPRRAAPQEGLSAP